MRYAAGVRSLPAVALVLSLCGCGLFGGNTDEVCSSAEKVLRQYATQIKSASAADPRPWKAATEKVAGQLDALAAKADDGDLRKALKDQAAALRRAAPAVGGGDVVLLNQTLNDIPQRIGKACS